MNRLYILAWLGVSLLAVGATAQNGGSAGVPAEKSVKEKQFKSLEKGASVLSLLPDGGLWVDLSRKWVVADGEVCLTVGPLEMFACPAGTKEHESVVAVKSSSRFVHAALLAIGAKTGKPVKFDPEYIPASGSVIDIICVWKDSEEKIQAAFAQDWVTKGRSKKTLDHAWVFAGSGFWKDSSTGERRYYADDGAMICVSNFPTATMDIAVESTKDNNFLEYHANSARLPEVGTPVRLIMVNRPGKMTKKTPRRLDSNAEILTHIKQWAQAIEAGKQPPKIPSPEDEPVGIEPSDK
ncbi:MAG: YdjY domain-containing protein [Pirellulaceae bacterium]